MKDCLFCKIAAGEIPSESVYEDEEMLAFLDIAPMAPTHILVIPKAHIASADKLEDTHGALVGKMILKAAHIARECGIAEDGYRILTNIGRDGGQTVEHLHFHIIGGRELSVQLG